MRIELLPGAVKPSYATLGSAGADLSALLEHDVTMPPGSIAVIPTGVKISKISPGLCGEVRSRSGLAANHGICVLNSPGTIDSDYEGEIRVILVNHSANPFVVINGMRVAQLVFSHIFRPVAFSTAPTVRGEGGLGSTGT